MSIDKTKDLPDYKHEIRIPLIICPICGEKDPEFLQLTEGDFEINNNLQEYWNGPHGPPHYYSPSQTKSCNISGHCCKCGSGFEFSIRATIPRDKALTSK